jgi:transposase
VETDPIRMCELLVGLPAVTVLGIDDLDEEGLVVHVETRTPRPGCVGCGVPAASKGRRVVTLVDMPCFGRSTRLVWHKRRWRCQDRDCPVVSFTEEVIGIAAPRMAITDRAGRWVTAQVGGNARSVSEVAKELGCDWHTVNDAVIAYGEALVDEEGRFGEVGALGLDEVLFVRLGPRHTREFSTSIADVHNAQLLDIVPGRSAVHPADWLESKGPGWRSQVRFATLDLSGTYRSVYDTCVPWATQVADPFHVIKHANSKLDECRRRIQNETLGHRGKKTDPLYRCRRLLTKADERLDEPGRERLLGLLRAGDPRGEVTMTWHAKEAIRSLYDHADLRTATEWIDRLITDMGDSDNPVEVRSLGRTLTRWREQILAWHRCHFTNGPTEAANNLIKRVKRAAFGFTSFRNYRVRALLYAGKPRWGLLATVTPH